MAIARDQGWGQMEGGGLVKLPKSSSQSGRPRPPHIGLSRTSLQLVGLGPVSAAPMAAQVDGVVHYPVAACIICSTDSLQGTGRCTRPPTTKAAPPDRPPLCRQQKHEAAPRPGLPPGALEQDNPGQPGSEAHKGQPVSGFRR